MTGAKILVVEDEVIVAVDIKTSLEDLGYQVVCVATTGEDAVLAAQTYQPDLVLMDIVLSGTMDGTTAAGKIHNDSEIPIIYLTAHSNEEILERARVTQPFGYLTKPFREVELRSAVQMALARHKLYQELKESQEWFSVTLNSIGDAVIATDGQNCVKFMNPVAEALTGWAESEARGLPLKNVFNTVESEAESPEGEFNPLMFGRLWSTSAAGCSILRSKNGDTKVVETNTAPIRDPQGNVLGEVLVFRDSTERRKINERLWLLSEVVEQSSEGVVVTDLNGTVIFLNKAFAQMHGYSPEEVQGQNLCMFHAPEQIPEGQEAGPGSMEQDFLSGEVWHARADGRVFPGLMHNSVLRDAMGNEIAVIGILRDISGIKKTQQELRASHEALEAYSSVLEAKVDERTRDLENSRAELKTYSEGLEKANEALKMVIESIEERKKDAEEKLTHSINLTVKPIVDQLKSQEIPETIGFLLQSLEYSLNNLFSPFGYDAVKSSHVLTPREIRICEMIRSGLSSKQIAKVMGISAHTVLVHRKNIRKKLQLDGSKRNLAAFLRAKRL